MARPQGQPTGRGALPVAATVRRLRSDPAASLTLVVIVSLSSLVLFGAPRLVNDLSDQAIQQGVGDASTVLRDITVTRNSRIIGGTGPDAFEAVAREQADFRKREFPESLQMVIAGETFVVNSPAWVPADPFRGEPPPFAVSLTMQYRRGIDDHILIQQGRLPTPRDPIRVTAGDGGEMVDVPLYEIAISVETQSRLQLDVGNRLLVTPDPEDPLAGLVPGSLLSNIVAIEISGVLDTTDPADTFWASDPSLLVPTAVLDGDFNVVSVSATGLIAPGDYRSLLRETRGALWAYAMHYRVDPELVTADAATQLASDLQNLESEFVPVTLAAINETGFSTGLSRILRDYLERRATMVSVLAIGTAGLILVSFGVVAVLATLTALRRRAETQLWRSRGASTGQLVSSRLGEGLALGLVGALIGFLAADQLGGSSTNRLPVAASAAVAASVAAILLAAEWPAVHRAGGDDVPRQPPSPRRLVLESVVIAVALGSLILLRRRGLVAGGASTADPGFDPLLAMSPALLGLAVGIITVHSYRWLIRPFAWASARGRSLVVFLGLRRIELQPPSAHLSLIAILLAVAVAVFASVLRVSVEQGQVESGWLAVGADYRITVSSGPPVDVLDLSGIAGVEATAIGVRFNRLSVRSDSSATPESADLLAVPIADHATVLAGSPVDPEYGAELLERPGAEPAGSEERPIPAIVSRTWAASGPAGPGETFSLRIGAERITFIVSETRERFAGLPFDRPFIVADLPTLQAGRPAVATRPSVAFIRAPGSAGRAIESAVSDLNPAASVISRHELLTAARRDVFSRGLRRSLHLSAGMVTLFASVAAIGGLALTAQTRRRHLGLVRTLGMTGRQALGLTLVEHLPPVTLAAVVGAAFGTASATLYQPGIDLGSFTGRGPVAPLHIELWSVAATTVVVVAAIMLIAGLFVLLTRRDGPATAVMMGEE